MSLIFSKHIFFIKIFKLMLKKSCFLDCNAIFDTIMQNIIIE